MNALEYAMRMEKDGEIFYKDLAKKTKNKGFKTILNELAEAEVKHYATFEAMKNNQPVELSPVDFLAQAQNIFQQMKKGVRKFDLDLSQVDLYKRAQELEQESVDFYLQQGKDLPDPTQKEIFNRIADEEKQHYETLANMIDFISKPQRWVEHAEFTHTDKYYQ